MRLTVACLFLGVGFVSRLAEATAALEVPIAVAFAKIFGRRIFDGVGNTDAVRLFDGGQLAAGGRGWERSERSSHLRTGDVVDADGQERDASALVAECEIDTFLRHRNGTDLRVDDHLRSSSSSSSSLLLLLYIQHSQRSRRCRQTSLPCQLTMLSRQTLTLG